MKALIVNFKNYREIMGEGSVSLAVTAEGVASEYKVEMIVSPPTALLGVVAAKVKIPVFSQAVGPETDEKSTGSDLPEAAKAAGAVGTLLNHSERRVAHSQLGALVSRARGRGLRVCLCAGDSDEAASLSRLAPDYLAVEPPELIGSGKAVSRARPEVIERTVKSVRRAGYGGRVLCGAGIVTGDDVRRAVELGADGILVSSGVVKAKDWSQKLSELARSLL